MKKRKFDHEVLLLQGGGALGAYQAGVYEGLVEVGARAPGRPRRATACSLLRQQGVDDRPPD
jgi:predicted acylesterase/phospholipase RssA